MGDVLEYLIDGIVSDRFHSSKLLEVKSSLAKNVVFARSLKGLSRQGNTQNIKKVK